MHRKKIEFNQTLNSFYIKIRNKLHINKFLIITFYIKIILHAVMVRCFKLSKTNKWRLERKMDLY